MEMSITGQLKIDIDSIIKEVGILNLNYTRPEILKYTQSSI